MEHQPLSTLHFLSRDANCDQVFRKRDLMGGEAGTWRMKSLGITSCSREGCRPSLGCTSSSGKGCTPSPGMYLHLWEGLETTVCSDILLAARGIAACRSESSWLPAGCRTEGTQLCRKSSGQCVCCGHQVARGSQSFLRFSSFHSFTPVKLADDFPDMWLCRGRVL